MILSIFIIFLCSSYYACAAGVGAHLSFLLKILSSSDSLTAKFNVSDPYYYPWLKSGTFFPDAFYTCDVNNKKWQQFAEYTHWPPFLTTSIEYWHKKYGADEDLKYSDSSIQLIAFLYGVFNHQVVDTSWHSLVSDYREHGLLRVLSELEFDGSLSDAHSFIDILGDTLILSDMLENMPNLHKKTIWEFYTSTNWQLPSQEDLEALVKLSGFNNNEITYQNIRECVSRGMYSINAEAHLLNSNKVLYNILAYEKSPKGAEYIRNHWLGGEYDLISLLISCSPKFFDFFDDAMVSIGISSLDFCRNLPKDGKLEMWSYAQLTTTKSNTYTQYTTRVPFSRFGSSVLTGFFYSTDTEYIAVTAPMEENLGSVYLIPVNYISENPTYFELRDLPVIPHYGTSIGKLSDKGCDILLVADASKSIIYFLKNGIEVKKIKIDDVESNQLNILSVYHNDTSGDSIILLGDPYYGKNEIGRVIFLQMNLEHEASINVNLSYIDINSKKIGSVKNYTHFGTAAIITDSSIYITAEGPGIVLQCNGRFISNSNLRSCTKIFEKDIEYNSNNELEIRSSNIHGNFGRVILSISYNGRKFVAISQDVFNKVYIYEETIEGLNCFVILTISTIFQPIPKSVKFGFTMVYDAIKSRLYIGSPGYNYGKGAIWCIQMSELMRSSLKHHILTLNTNDHLLIENGIPTAFSRTFGNSLALTIEGQIVIGNPDYIYNDLGPMQLTGSILVSSE
ncbi:hypothetical protein RNJ44_01198 [Nakaseomyces bracarensis]|uniref:Phospholipase C/D domain-containing protein n=1 Tax=Nakaseomyces bracarensis TaxID=273131 RepID=A0ABR4NR74_9SACH